MPGKSVPSAQPIQADLTRKVAALARLELSDAEVSSFTKQLAQVLEYVGQLQQADVSGVEPLGSPVELQEGGVMRDDEARPSPTSADGKPKVLSSAPEVMLDGFKVPPIL